MATIITLEDGVEDIKIYSSFIPSEQLAYQAFVERCENDGAVITDTRSCIINDYINDY